MKKQTKMKSPGKNKTTGPQLPDLVAGMIKLVERLETLERKTDQVLGRVANLPVEVRRAVQDLSFSQPSHQAQQAARVEPGQGPRERILHQAICADCCKRCEVPFKPSGDRPVYCPECWAIRKAGHVPKDIIGGIKVPNFPKPVTSAPQPAPSKRDPAKKKKQKNAKKSKR